MAIRLERYSAQLDKLHHNRIEDVLARAFEGRAKDLDSVLRDIRISCQQFAQLDSAKPLSARFQRELERRRRHLQRGLPVINDMLRWLSVVDCTDHGRPDLAAPIASLIEQLDALQTAIAPTAPRRRRGRPVNFNDWQFTWNVAVTIDARRVRLTAYLLHRVLLASDSPLSRRQDLRKMATAALTLLQEMRRLNPKAMLFPDWACLDDHRVRTFVVKSPPVTMAVAGRALHPRPWNPFG